MAHINENLIWQINLGDKVYDIHDAHAIHTLADLAALGIDVEGAFIFKGTVSKYTDLPTTNNKIGYVYHVTENHSEYVWAKVDSNGSEGWEEFGEHFVINHVHEVTVTGTNESSAVTGTATITGGNSTSAVSGTASVAVPSISESAVYAKVSTNNDTFVKSYSGATSKMVTTSVTGAGAATSVINSVNTSTGSITGVSGTTKVSKVTAGTSIDVATVGNDVTVATGFTGGSVSNGSAASWSASVENGVLSFNFIANNPTAVTLPTASTTTIKPAVASGTVTTYTIENVDVAVANSEATSIVTGVDTGSTNVATVGSAITVATGALASDGTGSAVMTGLGTASTASALTSAALAAGTTSDFHTGDDVTIGTQTVTGSIEGTAAAQVWTQNTGSVEGTAAAQIWTQTSGVTGNPIAE